MKQKSSKVLFTILTIIPGFVMGIILGLFVYRALATLSFGLFIAGLVGIIATALVSVVFSIALHEAGHLLFGLMTGYKFSSYRIFNLMWIKGEDGKIKRKKFSVAGTGGQCLLVPPKMKNGKFPVVLYNLGGVITNTIACILFLILFIVCFKIKYLALLMLIFLSINLTFALSNGIPLTTSGIDNDAKNALSIRKNPEAMRAFWIQMKINEENSKGKRLKDLPEEWFEKPSKEGMKNSIIATLAVYRANRLLDQKKFEESDELMKEIIEFDNATLLFYKQLLTCDRIYIELITQCRSEVIENMLSTTQKATMKAMKDYPSIIRTEYAYALLFDNDREKADKILEKFESIAENYPYESEISAERELINIAIEIAKEQA